MCEELKKTVEKAWDNRELLGDERVKQAIRDAIDLLDKGKLRTAEPLADGTWQVNEWVKKAVILYFPIQQIEVIEAGPLEFHDKLKLKTGYRELGVRVVPQATARYGAYLAPGVIMMPSYVNIGAYVDEGTMVDTWVTVGSCAQIGKRVHLSGGVGIGGVLEPVQAADVTGREPKIYKGYVPPRSVVIPGSYTKQFPAGTYQVPCALIIGQRKASTDLKTTLNDALREFNVSV